MWVRLGGAHREHFCLVTSRDCDTGFNFLFVQVYERDKDFILFFICALAGVRYDKTLPETKLHIGT